MIIDLLPAFGGDGREIPVCGEVDFSLKDMYGIKFPEASKVEGKVLNIGGQLEFSGDVKAKLVRFLGCRNTGAHEYFMSDTFTLKEGRHLLPHDSSKALISDVLAEMNGLEIGDIVTAEATAEVNGVSEEALGTEFHYEIVGIFSVTQPTEIGALTPECDVPENFIMTTEKDGLQALSSLYGIDTPEFLGGAIFFTEDPAVLHETAAKIKADENIDLAGLSVTVNDTLFRMSAEPLERLGSFMTVLSLVVFGVSIVLLSLILTMWMRERVRETGVYLAIGISKPGIFFQHFIECLMIAVVAFVLSWGIAGAAADAVGNAFITNMPEQTHFEQSENSLEKELLDEPLTVEYQAVETEAIHTDIGFTDWLTVAGIEVFVIFVSVGLSSLAVLRMKPKNILSIME